MCLRDASRSNYKSRAYIEGQGVLLGQGGVEKLDRHNRIRLQDNNADAKG